MGMVGADVDQLRALARNLTQAADRLEGMTGEVTGRLSAVPWQGQDASQFRSQWQGQSLGQIRAVVGALRDAATQIERNATEQDQASATSGSDGLLSTVSGAISGMMSAPHGQTLPASLSTPERTLLPPDLLYRLPEAPLQPFVDMRDYLASNTLWPINNGFAIGQVFPELGPVLPLVDALGIAGDTSLSPDDKIVESTHSLTDLGGGLLKDVIPGPVGYLSGVAVSQWGDVAYEVSKADFSPAAVQTTTNYIASDPAGAFDAAKDAVLGYVPKLISNLWK